MSESEIDFSAQFGGRDAAAVALPHFKALKAAAKGVQVSGFPIPELAFILRVDGDVNQYGLSGLGNPEVDRSGKYVSLDIGITVKDRASIETRLSDAILASDELIVATVSAVGAGPIDREKLRAALTTVVDNYRRRGG